ncbi:MAG TPA: hypothetical protein VHK90_08065 [Thermoanaerobaculia bacterium]|nr:hypothetical protein [Thermoanaerobaculia bacterium]
MKRLLILLLLLLPLTAEAQYFPDAEYERVLVPVFFFGGGSGAAWWSNFDLVNIGPSFELATAVLQGTPACPDFCGCDAKKVVEQNKAENICQAFEDNSGIILYVPRSVNRDEVFTYARVYDRSRAAERAGSQIPVVWERDLLEGTMMLLDVKIAGGYRATIRLFDALQWDTTYTLRFYDMAKLRTGNNEIIFQTQVHSFDENAPGRFPARPSFGVIGNVLAQYPQLAGYDSVAIEILPHEPLISPPAPTKRHYALASITNNTTQEVTIVSPR